MRHVIGSTPLVLLIQDSKASNGGNKTNNMIINVLLLIFFHLLNVQFLELYFLHREIGQLRAEYQNQNKDIAMLKEMTGFKNNRTITDLILSLIIKELNDKKMKEPLPLRYTEQNHDPSSRVASRNKRPYRLLSVNSLDGSNKQANRQSIHSRFNGPPTNCSDLSQLGYTLNGFYLVQSITKNTNDSVTNDDDDLKIDTVYCTFKLLYF